MITDMDDRLVRWLGNTIPDVQISLSPPPPAGGAVPVINLYLYEIRNAPVLRGIALSPLQALLRYVVTVTAGTIQEEHALLSDVLFAALDSHELTVDLDPLPATLWSAFNLPPRPSIVLCATVRRERSAESAPLIRQPLVMRLGPVGSLSGRVVGHDQMPRVGASVYLPALDVKKKTNYDGRFSFSGLPTDASALRIVVRTKGQEIASTIQQVLTENGELVVTVPNEEG